jgi:transposase-like protein
MVEAIDLCELVERFSDDQKCRNYLEGLRWKHGVRCPKCNSDRISSILKRDQFDCDSCRYQFSVTAGTIFHDTHLPLTKWFLATFLICQSRKGMSANQLKRMLRINYRTAWYLCHRIRHAMIEVKQPKLDGVVEMDETYVGGKQKGIGSRGPYGSHKEIVIGIRKRGGDLRFFHAGDTRSVTLNKYIRENIDEDVEVIVTDEHPAYPTAMGHLRDKHHTVNHSKKEYARGDIHTNTVESAFSLLKRGIVGTWHRISAKHLAAYLDEMTWRFNNRDNPFLFRDTMIKLIQSDNLEYKELTKAA